MNRSSTFKKEHLESAISQIINKTIKNDIYDNIIKKATILDVELSNDFSHVNVYVDTFNRDEVEMVIAKMNAARGFFRKKLSEELTIRKTPQIHFKNDKSIDRALRIDELIKKIHKE